MNKSNAEEILKILRNKASEYEWIIEDRYDSEFDDMSDRYTSWIVRLVE